MTTIKNNIFTKELISMILIAVILAGFALYFFRNSEESQKTTIAQNNVTKEIDKAVTNITNKETETIHNDEYYYDEATELTGEQENNLTPLEKCEYVGPTPDILHCLYKLRDTRSAEADKIYKETVIILSSITDKESQAGYSRQPARATDAIKDFLSNHEKYYNKECDVYAYYTAGNGNPYKYMRLTCEINGYNKLIETMQNVQSHFK